MARQFLGATAPLLYTPGANPAYVLKSDASGNALWKPHAQQITTTVTTLPLSTTTKCDSLALPAGLAAGTMVRFTSYWTNTSTASSHTLSSFLLFGTSNTSSDATITSAAWGAGGTSTAGAAIITGIFMLPTTTTANGSMEIRASSGFTSSSFSAAVPTSSSVTVAVSSGTFLGLYGSSTLASIFTCRQVVWEIVAA